MNRAGKKRLRKPERRAMQLYLAPMEGITTYIFRNAYHTHFGGADKYFTPFLSNSNMTRRDENEILPEHNCGMTVIPQILTNRAEEFLAIASRIADLGYDTVNLNLGCPSGTVVAKKRGVGFLSDPVALDRFLDQIYEACPLRISIKTRIGISHLSEWEDLLHIYRKYPIEELIIHPRLQQDFYNGTPHYSAYRLAGQMLEGTAIPLCYNGDIISSSDPETLSDELPGLSRVMIGRGILMNPDLIGELHHTAFKTSFKERFRSFHDEIYHGYREIMSGDTPTLYKMKDLWNFMGKNKRFPNPDKLLKKIRKAQTCSAYDSAVSELLSCL